MTLASILVLGVAQAVAGIQSPLADCADIGVRAISPAVAQVCQGDEESKAAEDAPQGPERTRHLGLAVDHYRRAADLGEGPLKVRALEAVARLYDPKRLNDLARLEFVLRDLIASAPAESRFLYDLAKVQEDRGLFDAAEDTLLSARLQWPNDPERFKRLAQFYARRATATQAAAAPPPPVDRTPATPDDQGIYEVGGNVQRPHRTDQPHYPPDAQVAGIQGSVEAEIVVDETGTVTDAKVVRSVPLLDDPALAAVRQWKFEPATVNGQPVPVRMKVTVRFSLSN